MRSDVRADKDSRAKNNLIGVGTSVITMPFRPPLTESITLSFVIGMASKEDTPVFAISEVGGINLKC